MQGELVDLHDNAIDFVLDVVAVLTVIRDVLGRAGRAVVHAEVAADRQSPALEQTVDLALG